MDRDAAYNKLFQSLNEAQLNLSPANLPSSIRSGLESIILGDHLTFRYILVTAILGKAVDPSIHMRALQAQAPLAGAYDARSLCHCVVVPFERDKLALRLGGSNEPFLNKPARFVSVDKANPVRGGRDKRLLDTLYDVLEALNSENQSIIESSLVYSLQLTLKREAKFSSTIDTSSIFATQTTLLYIIKSIISVCSGGECAVIVAGAILRALYSGSANVRISPVNQAGSSSKGVGDIDLMKNGIVFCAVEVKDKIFTEFDVLHATRVARDSNVNRLLFVIGSSVPESTLPNIEFIISKLAQEGFDISFTFVEQFSSAIISLLDHEMRQAVIDEIPNIVDEIRSTDMTKHHIYAIYANLSNS